MKSFFVKDNSAVGTQVVAALAYAISPLVSPGGTLILPIAGVGLMFGALAIFLVFGGAVGELIYATGDPEVKGFSRLLAREVTGMAERSGSEQSRDETSDV